MFRAAIAADTPLGRGGRADPRDRGELVPDELTIALIARAPRRGDARRRASSSTAFRATCRRPRRSTSCSPSSAARSTPCSSSRSPTRRCSQRLLGRAAEEGRADDTPEAIAAAARDLPRARPRRSSSHYLPTGQRRRHPRRARRSTRCGPRSRRRSSRWRAAARDHPQVAAGDRADGDAPARIVAETLALIGEHVRPGRDDGRARRARRRVHPLAGRLPDLQGLPRATRRRRACPRTTWSCTGSRATIELEEGDILSADVGVTLDGFVADSAYTFPVGEISAEAERLLDVVPGGARGGRSSSAALGNRLSDISHAIQRVTEERGLLGRPRASSATASAARCTRTRRSRTSASRAAGRCSRRA